MILVIISKGIDIVKRFRVRGKRFSNSQARDIRLFYIVYFETELNSLCCISNAIVVVFPKLAHTVLWLSYLLFLHTILHIFDLTLLYSYRLL